MFTSSNADQERQSFEFRWSNLGILVATGKGSNKPILQDVSGSVCAGEMLALLGPSGSGKTSLIRRLSAAGLEARQQAGGMYSGSIEMDGAVVTKNMRHRMAYMAQIDVLFPNLTVLETITYAAKLRRPARFTLDQQMANVRELITMLRLDACQHTQIALLSGGQKHRVSLAVELVADPVLIIADEPTSGLDANSVAALIDTFRQLANRGKAVICSIHQPTSAVFQQFDKVLLMASGGRVAYYGAQSQVGNYLASIGHACPPGWNAADFMLDQVTESGDHLCEVFARVPSYGHCSAHVPSSDAPVVPAAAAAAADSTWSITWREQFVILLQRAFQQKRGEIITRAQTVRIMAVSLISSLVWYQLAITARHAQDRFGALFFVVSFWYMASMITAAAAFPAERAVIVRERRSRSYRLSTYFLAKSISELPVQMVYPVAFVCVYYWMIGFTATAEHFFAFLGCTLLVATCGESLGLLISNLIAHAPDANITCNIVCNMLLMLAGFYARIPSLPVGIRWAAYLGFPRYIFAILGRRELAGLVFPCEPDDRACVPTTGQRMIEENGMDTLDPWQGALLVAGMTVAFRVAAYFALERITRAV